mmetsp:Transcript_3558/g.6120  ORF Transcript_3558/g.6120 Transcript_3558/m.6120 type:complete len:660 (+) Transcript_3558:62-2041(+)
MGKGKSHGARRGGGTLGAALLNGQKKNKQARRAARLTSEHEEETIAALGFGSVAKSTKSVTETNQLEAFLADALLSGRNFEAQRASRIISLANDTEIEIGGQGNNDDLDNPVANFSRRVGSESMGSFDFRSLPIPRRPAWTRDMSAAELASKEREAFLTWRRQIAAMEASNDKLHVTPFEKNLDYWRQLWRVVERSDLVVQVVDARNPLLFRCEDVENFTRELSPHKRTLLLVNKADYLPDDVRNAWCTYFNERQIPFVFFSAKREQNKLDAGEKNEPEDIDVQAKANTNRLLLREELLSVLEALTAEAKPSRENGENADGKDEAEEEKATLGMIGYPNVGKSSVINVIVGVTATDHSSTRVSVAATPGHTKHFQTLHLSKKTVLCDCPGLVFPTFMKTKADLLCNGILPIDEIRGRDFVPAIEVLTDCLDRKVFEETYAMQLPLAPTIRRVSAEMLIEEFCKKRGYMGSGHDRFNESHGARILLKDFVRGKLCYCCPPPDANEENKATVLLSAPGVEKPVAGTDHLMGHDTIAEEESDDDEGDGDDDGDDDDMEIRPLVSGGVNVLDEDLEAQLRMLELDADASDQLIYDETTKVDIHAKASRTKRRHGRKHRKARDPDPYSANNFFLAKQTGKKHQGKEFTRLEFKGQAAPPPAAPQ